MLSQLLGSKSAAETLLFLLVNQKGYPTQISQCLHLPQTPIQKALERLEKSGIIVSYREGRTKIYQMNPSYPLKKELEKLLQRTFTLLPAEKKERYPFSTPPSSQKDANLNTYAILENFWTRLKEVSKTLVRVIQTDPTPFTYRSEGTVSVTPSKNILIFEEEGVWKDATRQPIHYRNRLKWTRHYTSSLVSLEHLRYGENHPVFMFYLSPKTKTLLQSTTSHLCAEDTYFGKLHLEGTNLKLIRKTLGPNKNETIESIYS